MTENNRPLIAGTYKILKEIGSGGGGIVYLGEHVRLGKKVVLKADKRTLSAKPEVLRREVDALKNLSHTYIPQVYDFIEEAGTIYTVMDFIDGDSFDKPLKNGVRFTQVQVIEWACQLLEALSYLHNRPPHGILHADIKPANIMLTPQGDVRLIDFNIALALGEEGAIAVGRSFGYASPEHYGQDFSPSTKTQITNTQNPNTSITTDLSTETVVDVSNVETVMETDQQTSSQRNSSYSYSSSKSIMLNVRSDIYSLGATLYHILTGEKPARNAPEVKPISPKDFSPAVIAIIAKAMNPDQEQRWNTAEEMLDAFKHLRENDPRTKRYKKAVTVTVSLLMVLFLSGGLTIFAGQRMIEQEQRQLVEATRLLEQEQRLLAEEQSRIAEEQSQLAEEQGKLAQLNEAYVLAEYSANALRDGDIITAIQYALEAIALTDPVIAEAQKALTDALGVYDLSDGYKNHKTVELPSSPLFMRISPDGKTAAAIYASYVAVFDTETAEIVATLPTDRSALSEVKFRDNNTIIYAGDKGISAYNFANSTALWMGRPATSINISADGRSVAALYRDEDFATVYDTADGSITYEINFDGKHQRVPVNDIFANPDENIFALNDDGTKLGISFSDGSLWVYDLKDRQGDIQIFDETFGFMDFQGGFYQQFFAFAANHPAESLFAVIDTKELIQVGGFNSHNAFSVLTDENGIYVKTNNILVSLCPDTGEQTALVDTFERIESFAKSLNHTLITTRDEFMFFDKNANLVARHEKEFGSDFLQITEGMALIGSLDAPVIRIMKYESHPHTEIFSYDPSYRHDEARISADRQTVMLYSNESFRLYHINGDFITEVSIPDAAHLNDKQYRRDEKGSRLEFIYNDGTIRAYCAKDGAVLYETKGEPPDMSLFMEFFTDKYRIEAPLHGTPAAFDLITGELVRELERDSYLTYVTQVGEYIVTEYMTGDGFRFGLLLNSQLETLAYLPYLCDIVGDMLIFNYKTGNLRESRIFNIQELIGLTR